MQGTQGDCFNAGLKPRCPRQLNGTTRGHNAWPVMFTKPVVKNSTSCGVVEVVESPEEHGDANVVNSDEAYAKGTIDGCDPMVTSEFRQLEKDQKALEDAIRKLLMSMNELKAIEKREGLSQELEKRRRVEMTNIMHMLVLERRNLQIQNDALRREVKDLMQRIMSFQKRVGGGGGVLYSENYDLNSQLRELGAVEARLTRIPLMRNDNHENSSKPSGDATNADIQQVISENKRLKSNLLSVTKQLEDTSTKLKKAEEVNGKFRSLMEKHVIEAKNLRKGYDQLLSENESLKSQLTGKQKDDTKYASKSYECDELQEALKQVQVEKQRMEQLYQYESQLRKRLQNEIQDIRGNFRVFCRCRPKDSDDFSDIFHFPSEDRIEIFDPGSGVQPVEALSFQFDRTFQPCANQEDVFQEIKPLITSCLDGYNICIMAYGPTGSGKTFTMLGLREDPGITVRAITELAEIRRSMCASWNIDMRLSMLEIHNEVIYDLLNKRVQTVRLSDDGIDVRLVDVHEEPAENEQDLLYWMSKGLSRRKMVATKLNMHSSRSHLITRIQLSLSSKLNDSKSASSMVFCDLAGSESAERIQATGNLFIETGYINKSLATLGRVLDSLRTHSPLVPYRDSKLTHLLKPCLGEQAKCVLIIAVSNDPNTLARSIKAIEFGQKAKQISVGTIKRNVRILPTKITSYHQPLSTDPSPVVSR